MTDISKLTAEERKALAAQLAEQEKADKLKRSEERKAFKQLSAEYVQRNIDTLVHHHSVTDHLIASLFNDFNSILALKESVYGTKVSNQESHTSTLEDGSASITIGYNVSIGFDGTETMGVEKIKEFLASLSSDDANVKKLSKAVNTLLKPSAKTGMLNPASIIQLSKLRDDFNSELFNEGLDIIINSQQRRKNSMYVSGWKFIKDEQGKAVKLDFRFTV